jgi:hypothetical protein
MKYLSQVCLATIIATACAEAPVSEETVKELGTVEQELHVGAFDPQFKNGVFFETGPFYQVGVERTTPTPFGAYVLWKGNDFARVGAFGSLSVDLTLPDAATFPAANPAAPILYEYAEDADCDFTVLPSRVSCTATEHVYFTPPGVPGFVAPFNWKMTKIPSDPHYIFNSGDPNGNSVDAFNYRIKGQLCLDALERMRTFYATTDAVFDDINLNDTSVCN